MTEETALAPLPELETPAIEAPEVEAHEAETEVPQTVPEYGEEAEDNVSGDDIAEPEFITVERNGKSFQVPKELEGEFFMQADYTKKTQSVADRAKALDEREASIVKQAKASEAELDARASLRGITAELAEYQKLTPYDWQQHMQNDPLGTQQHRLRYEALRDQKADLESTIGKAQTERTEKAQQDFAKRVQETLDAAASIIPGITAETRGPAIDKLVAFANSEGIPEQVLKDNWSPQLLKLLHKASVGAAAIAKQSAPKPAPKQPVEPLQTVRAATSSQARTSLEDIAKSGDMEAYAKARAGGRSR